MDIEARAADPAYVLIAMLIEEANDEYTMLVASNCWGPQGKPDPGNAPEALFTKADINTRIQNQISAALHQNSNNNKKAAQTSNEKQKMKSNNTQKASKEHKPCISKAPWKAKPPSMGEAKTKEVDGKMWHWCSHCGFGGLSYGSATHIDPATLTPMTPSTTPPPSTSVATTTLQFCGDLMFGNELLLGWICYWVFHLFSYVSLGHSLIVGCYCPCSSHSFV